jgi:hypothetical protein
MQIKVNFEGLIFTGNLRQGAFARGEVRCPNCQEPIEPQAGPGGAYLICSSVNRGCVKPSKSFGDENSMRDWLEAAWEAVGDQCRKGLI